MSTKQSKISLKFASLLIVISLFTGSIGGGATSYYFLKKITPNNNTQNVTKITEQKVYVEESSLIEAREKVVPAVVSIIGLKEQTPVNIDSFFFDPFFFDPFFNNPNKRRNTTAPTQPKNEKPEKKPVTAGTGFIIKPDGLVLTNRHVVDDASAEYMVVMNDGTEYSAEVKSKDPLNDIAFIQMKPKDPSDKKKIGNLPVATLGDSGNIKIGQRVIAIGNALSQYQNTTTSGIISALGRSITAGDGMGKSETLTGLLQTDAAINPGNSGGPLVNMNGEVIGINTAIDREANGIGFAIPMNDIKSIIASLEKNGKIVRPIVGVRYIILTEEKAKELQINVTHGALLVGNPEVGEFAVIPGGPGDKAGLKMADVILKVDDKDITIDYTLQDAIRNKQPGDKLKLKVWRNGQELDIEVTLGEQPGE